MQKIELRGVEIYKSYLDVAAQRALVGDLRQVVTQAPLFQPQTARGQSMSVRMSAAGQFGWYSDSKGYRYVPQHPSGVAWPPIPDRILQIWSTLTGVARLPECCLINYYDAEARMGMHQDRDEADFQWPVLSISLGDSGLFRVGNLTRGGKTQSIWLESGDVVVMGGDARLVYHGVDRIKPGTSTLMERPGRINLTLRVVT